MIRYDLIKFCNNDFKGGSATRFGFVAFAETCNGQVAMLGSVICVGTELLTGQ